MIKSSFTAKITSKGQITIPRAMRDRLGLHKGDTLMFVEDETGVRVEKTTEKSPFGEWYGHLSHIESTSDEIFEELRGRKIGEVPGEERRAE